MRSALTHWGTVFTTLFFVAPFGPHHAIPAAAQVSDVEISQRALSRHKSRCWPRSRGLASRDASPDLSRTGVPDCPPLATPLGNRRTAHRPRTAANPPRRPLVTSRSAAGVDSAQHEEPPPTLTAQAEIVAPA